MTRYKLIDSEGYTKNIIVLEQNSNWQCPEGYTIELDDGVYKYRVAQTNELILLQIAALERMQTPRLIREAALNDEFAISKLKELDDQIIELRKQLSKAK